MCCLTWLGRTSAEGKRREAAFHRSVQGLTGEAKRIAVPITPVNPNGDELYHILRKRLFEKVAPDSDIEQIAGAYREALRQAVQMNLTSSSPETLFTRIKTPIHSTQISAN